MTTKGIQIRWQEPTPKGTVQRVMDLKAESGSLEAQSQSGTLNKASGTLYREDRARAQFTAPIVEAAKDKKTVVARGGVKVTSIDPPGYVVSADRVTWYPEKNKLIGEGNATYQYTPPGAKTPLSYGNAEHVTVDTSLQTFHIP